MICDHVLAALQLGAEGANLAAMQGLQPYLQANGSQAPPNNILQVHPSLQGEPLTPSLPACGGRRDHPPVTRLFCC